MQNNTEHLTTRLGKLYSKLSGQDHLVHVEHFIPQKSTHKKHGSLYFVLDVNHPNKDSQKIIDSIVETTITNFYKNLEDTLNSLEVTLRHVNEKLADLAEQGNTHWINNLSGLIAVIQEHDLHITQTGTSEAFLIRNKIISHITEGLSEKNDDKHPLNTFINISSGKMNLGDRIVMSTEQLYNNLSLDRIRRLAIQHSPTTCIAEIARILAQENVRCIGTIVIEATTEEKLAKEVIKPQPEEVILQDKQFKGTPFSEFINQSKDFLNNSKDKIATIFQKITSKNKNGISPTIANSTKKTKRKPIIEPKKSTRQSVVKPVEQSKNILSKLNQKAPNKQVIFISIIILLVIALSLSITYLKNRQNINQKKSLVEQKLSEIETLNTQAESALIIGEKQNAKDKYTQALELIDSIKTSPYYSEQIASLTDKISNKLDSTDQVARIDISKPLADLSTLSTNKFTQLYKIKENLFSINKNIASINQNNGKITNITGFDINNFIGGTLIDESNSLVIYHNGQMQKFNPTGNTLQDMTTLDSAWKPATNMASYYNNLYLLSPMENQIYKYSQLGGNDYSSADKYVVNPNNVDLANGVSLTIDGSVYLLKKDGKVIKFDKGEESEYLIKNIPEPYSILANPNQIYTEENLDFIYISDPGNKRILEIRKETGEYVRQFVNDKLGSIDGFTVNAKIKTIYLLSDNKVYSVTI